MKNCKQLAFLFIGLCLGSDGFAHVNMLGIYSRWFKTDPEDWKSVIRSMGKSDFDLFFRANHEFKKTETWMEHGSERRYWRLWDALAAMFFGTAIFTSQQDFEIACRGFSMTDAQHGYWQNGEYFHKRARVGVENLVGPVMKEFFAKYVQVCTLAREKKIGVFAKHAKPVDELAAANKLIVESSPYASLLTRVAVNVGDLVYSGENCFYATREGGVLTVTISPSASRLAMPVFRSLVSQNQIFEESIDKGTHSSYVSGLMILTGAKIKALEAPDKFFQDNAYHHNGIWNNAQETYMLFSGEQAWRNPLNPMDHASMWGFVEPRFLGLAYAPKIISRSTSGGNWVLGGDLQPYSNGVGPLLSYRDAAFDLSAGGATVALISGDAAENYSPNKLYFKATRSVPDGQVYGSHDSFRKNVNTAYHGFTHETEGWDTVIEPGNPRMAQTNAEFAKSYFADALPIPPPPGMAGFTCVSVPANAGDKGPFVVLCHESVDRAGEGIPYLYRDGNWVKLLSSELQSTLRFCKISCGAADGTKIVAISSKPDAAKAHLWVLAYSNIQQEVVWRDTGLVVNGASINETGKLALIDAIGVAYKVNAEANFDAILGDSETADVAPITPTTTPSPAPLSAPRGRRPGEPR